VPQVQLNLVQEKLLLSASDSLKSVGEVLKFFHNSLDQRVRVMKNIVGLQFLDQILRLFFNVGYDGIDCHLELLPFLFFVLFDFLKPPLQLTE
jgi:hypothetical protein